MSRENNHLMGYGSKLIQQAQISSKGHNMLKITDNQPAHAGLATCRAQQESWDQKRRPSTDEGNICKACNVLWAPISWDYPHRSTPLLNLKTASLELNLKNSLF